MNENDYLVWLRSISGVGNQTIEYLIKKFGNAKNIYNASIEDIKKLSGINKSVIHNIIENKDLCMISRWREKMEKYKIDIITKKDKEYPKDLKYIYNAPYLLFKRGNFSDEDTNAVAIVGSRKASPYGKYVAYHLAKELAQRKITVVSGMAYGIDTMAHKGAIENGGRTISILGCGLNICYPKTNQKLMLEIEKSGVLLSEYGVDVEPLPQHFPARNRIISGIAKGLIVVEAGIKSGSLISAELALEQGKEVFAVPGNINHPLSEGTNRLIQQGAKLVTNIEDVLEELNIGNDPNPIKNLIHLSDIEKEIYYAIYKSQPMHLELICQQLNLRIDEINGILTVLELKDMIKQLPGNLFMIK
ncbi:DNA-processing protein DprA [Inediibacterium massiliense]|uniref:DNA-processing protein DprA n=1 Tax=Inediibacterium massiliense TaxID=1658111 RepID=UPI0006B3F981|nr:DNA-processing protein DprA [Inediibacterium massiliense]